MIQKVALTIKTSSWLITACAIDNVEKNSERQALGGSSEPFLCDGASWTKLNIGLHWAWPVDGLYLCSVMLLIVNAYFHTQKSSALDSVLCPLLFMVHRILPILSQ